MNGLISVVNWYTVIGTPLFGSEQQAEYWSPVLGAALIPILIFILSLFIPRHSDDLKGLPDEAILPKVSLNMESLLGLFWNMVNQTFINILGSHYARAFAPLLGGLFFFILVSNLSGIIPGFSPATAAIDTSLALGMVVFISFNYFGLKVAGLDYIKHLFGPVIFLAPVMFLIEFISLCARPVSLSLRLTGNLYGDHMVFSAFSTLLKNFNVPFLPIPAFMLAYGVFVACLQAFIFVTLSAIYLKLSLETAHHD